MYKRGIRTLALVLALVVAVMGLAPVLARAAHRRACPGRGDCACCRAIEESINRLRLLLPALALALAAGALAAACACARGAAPRLRAFTPVACKVRLND